MNRTSLDPVYRIRAVAFLRSFDVKYGRNGFMFMGRQVVILVDGSDDLLKRKSEHFLTAPRCYAADSWVEDCWNYTEADDYGADSTGNELHPLLSYDCGER